MPNYEIVVIGAGLAGLEVTSSLAGLGRNVLLVDAKKSLTERVHTTGIFVRKTLEDFAFPPGTLGPAVSDVSLYSPNGKQLKLTSPHEEYRVGRMKELYTARLEQCRAVGAKIHLDTRLTGIETTPTETKVHLNSAGQSFQVTSQFIVGADGAQSRVAKSLKLSENHRTIVGLEKLYHSSPVDDFKPEFHCLIDPVLAPGYLAWYVDDGETIHVGVGGNSQRFDPCQALELFEIWVSKHLPDQRGEFIEKRGGLIPVGGILPKIANQYGLLVGDASGAVSPLTAGGLDPCLRLSRVAALVIDEFLRTKDPLVLGTYNGGKIRKKFRNRLVLRKALEACRWRGLINNGWSILTSPIGIAFAKKVMFGRRSFPDIQIATKVQTQNVLPTVNPPSY